jgi:H(+)-transporting ATP synthase subunit D
VTSSSRPAATRQSLLALRSRLERVGKGTTVLRRKREALVTELFRVARSAAAARASITERAATAYPSLLEALEAEGADGLRALGWPSRELRLELRTSQVWGIPIAEILGRPPLRRTAEARGVPPGSASPSAHETAAAFEELTELLLDAANRESLLRRLGDALARTSRQVNMLEHRLAPALAAQLGAVRRTLEEREREEHLRLARLLRARD